MSKRSSLTDLEDDSLDGYKTDIRTGREVLVDSKTLFAYYDGRKVGRWDDNFSTVITDRPTEGIKKCAAAGGGGDCENEMEVQQSANDSLKDDMDELITGMGKLNTGPIKVMIIPFAHGGVRQATDAAKRLVKGMDVKLITSTSGTCTLMKPNSYFELFSAIAIRVRSGDYIKNPIFDKQLLDYFNNFQNHTVATAGLGTPTYLEDINEQWFRVVSKQTPEGYFDVVSNTYKLFDFDDKNTSTKIYEPIPKDNPLWDVIEPIKRIVFHLFGIDFKPSDYNDKPFVIYMYIDHNGKFRAGITPDTYTGITLHEILHNTDQSIKGELEGRPVRYVVADPNCAYGDATLKFGGKRKYKKHTKRKTKKRKTKKRKTKKCT
jgi:hypothetical protein